MPLTTHTLTLTTLEPDNATPVEGKWRVWFTTEHGVALNNAGGMLAGSDTATTTSGVATFTLPDTAQTGFDPAGAYYRAAFVSTDRRVRLASEPFLMDGNKTTADIFIPTDLPITPSLVARAETAAEAAEAALAGFSGVTAAVTSVNTRTGAIVLAKSDVGLGNVDNTSDASKPVSTAQAAADTAVQSAAATDATTKANAAQAAAIAASQPLDSDLTAIAALTTTAYGRAFLALANQGALMALLAAASDTSSGVVELATSAETLTGTDTVRAVTPAGVKAAVDALVNSAPGALDTLGEIATQLASDESAVSALTTTVAGKLAKASNLSDLTDASAARTNLGLGTAATQASTAFQAADSDLTAIAALTTTSYGRAFLALTDAAAARTAIGLGSVDNTSDLTKQTAFTAAPSYAGLRANPYNPVFNVYNWKPSNTRKLRSSLGKAQAGTGLAHHTFIGESTTQSYNGVTHEHQGMWPVIYRNLLAGAGIPAGGSGIVPAGMAPANLTSIDSRVTLGGTWTNSGGYITTTANGATYTFTSTQAGTSVDIWTFNSNGTTTWTIDGVAQSALPSGGSATLVKTTVTGLANTTHTVVITTTSTTSTSVAGVNVYGASGLLVHNLAIYGVDVSTWVANLTGLGWPAVRQGMAGAYTQDVLFIAPGINDTSGGRTPTQIAADITTIRQQSLFSSADCVLVLQYQPSGFTGWDALATKLYDLADTLDVPLVDLYHRSGGYTAANANGLMGDTWHPSKAAQRDWGRNLATIAAGGTGTIATVAGQTGPNVTLTKSDVGLGSVDNTQQQPLDATLTAIAALTTAANKLIYATGSDAFTTTDLTAFARTLIDDADAPTARTTLGVAGNPLVPGSGFAETVYRPLAGSVAVGMTSGQLRLVALPLRLGDIVTNITFYAGTTAGASLTHTWFALYDKNRNLLATTADDTSATWTASVAKTLALSSPYTITASDLYYLGIVVVGTTMPTQLCYSGSVTAIGYVPILNGTSTTGLTTPGGAPNPAAAITAGSNIPYAYVS